VDTTRTWVNRVGRELPYTPSPVYSPAAAGNSGGGVYGSSTRFTGISGMEEPATASTICAQLTTTSDLQRVTDILEEGMPTEGLLGRKIVWGEGPCGEPTFLGHGRWCWKARHSQKRPQCGNHAKCQGHPVPRVSPEADFGRRLRPKSGAPSTEIGRRHRIDQLVLSDMLGLVGLPQGQVGTSTDEVCVGFGHFQHTTGSSGEGRLRGKLTQEGT
jgi:hypothetical protein